MEDSELRDRLSNLETKIAAAYESAEKTRKYILIIVIITVVAFVLPLIGLFFAVPSFLSTLEMIQTL